MDLDSLSSPARNALKLLASNCANSSTADTSAPQSWPKDFWFYTFIFCFTFLLIQCIFVSITVSTSHEARDTLIDEPRNMPSHKLHRVLESKYINHIGIQTPELEHVERYPSVTFVEDPVTWKKTITVVEDLAWVVPVDEEETERQIPKERGIMSEEEEVGLILRDSGLENDQDVKPGNGMRRSGDEPPAYDEEGEYALPRWRGHVNP
jgi:hypothetical protein